MFTPEEVTELEDKARAAYRALQALQSERREHYDVLSRARLENLNRQMDALREQIGITSRAVEAEVNATYKSRIDAQKQEMSEAWDLARKARLEVANGHPMVGKKVFARAGGYSIRNLYGIVEVFVEGDPVPSNKKWGLPTPGTLVVRLLKADGSRSTRFERCSSWGNGLPGGWKVVE
jgi:hypothetical protein